MATSAPAAARLKARLLPIRLAAPVTSAVFGWRLSNLLRQGRLLGGFGAIRLALRGGGAGGRTFAVAIKRILLARPLHLDHDFFTVAVDLVVLAVGLPAVGNHLQTHGIANGDNVDCDLAVLITFELKCALVPIALHGVEDHRSVGED